jgi:hypothetical protein
MSDDENVSMEVAPTKKKRQLSQEQLDKLAIARQKSNLVRKNKSEEKLKMREKENELKRLQAQAKADDIDDQINQLSSKPTAKSKKRAPRKRSSPRKQRAASLCGSPKLPGCLQRLGQCDVHERHA